jgi:hypothetical protein
MPPQREKHACKTKQKRKTKKKINKKLRKKMAVGVRGSEARGT